MKKQLAFVEQGFTVLSLIVYSSGPLPLIISGGVSEGDADELLVTIEHPAIQIIFFLNYLVSALLLLLRWRKAIYALKKSRSIWLLMGIAVTSIIWSVNPAKTQIRSIALVGTSLFGLYIASRYSIREQLKLLGWAFGAILLMSVVFAVAMPKYGLMGGIHAGAWRGIYVHKNLFSRVMVFSALVCGILGMEALVQRWLPWTGFGLSFCLLLLSRSSSSMINFVTLLMLFPLYSTLRWSYPVMIPMVMTIVTIGSSILLWFSANAVVVLNSIGKDATLTGRADMWPYMVDIIAKQPWLGYGYSAVWIDWDSPGAYVWRAAKWVTPNAHNGFLDLWLELGLLGVLVFAIDFGKTLFKGITRLQLSNSAVEFWPLLYLTYMVIANLGESSLLSRNDIFWVIYVTVSLSLAIAESSGIKLSTTTSRSG